MAPLAKRFLTHGVLHELTIKILKIEICNALLRNRVILIIKLVFLQETFICKMAILVSDISFQF